MVTGRSITQALFLANRRHSSVCSMKNWMSKQSRWQTGGHQRVSKLRPPDYVGQKKHLRGWDEFVNIKYAL